MGLLLKELRALLSPQPGGALDRLLHNLTVWAHSLDTQDNSLKVEVGSGREPGGAGPTASL